MLESVRMHPRLKREPERAARRPEITPAQFVIDALRTLLKAKHGVGRAG